MNTSDVQGFKIDISTPKHPNVFVLVDEEDFEKLNQWKWYYNTGCAVRGYPRRILMHREIMGNPVGKEVDHINMNRLDNRRANLRIVTRSQNLLNRNKQKNNTSGFKGVSWKDGRWYVQLGVGKKKNLVLGYFDDIQEAAKAYDIAAKKFYGKVARLNYEEKKTT